MEAFPRIITCMNILNFTWHARSLTRASQQLHWCLALGVSCSLARTPVSAAPVLVASQEERNCNGTFFMLPQFRLLSFQCTEDPDRERELNRQVSPHIPAPVALFPWQMALCPGTADDPGATARPMTLSCGASVSSSGKSQVFGRGEACEVGGRAVP